MGWKSSVLSNEFAKVQGELSWSLTQDTKNGDNSYTWNNNQKPNGHKSVVPKQCTTAP